jgi:hypothetical protein
MVTPPVVLALLLGLLPQAADNLVLVTLDGLRWQEVFAGADSAVINVMSDTARASRLREGYWRSGPEPRRQALMPFLWGTVALQGQILGDRYAGGGMRVTNGLRFSYPGYNELLTGWPDRRIDSNAKVPNPNVTVLEWLHRQSGFRGRMAVFSTWDVFPYIVNEARSGIPVNAGWEPIEAAPPTQRQRVLNNVMAGITRLWEGERYDALTWEAAREYLERARPRVLYVALGETDDWAHEGRYELYLEAAHRADTFIHQLWEWLQSDPQYQGRTALLITTDHGRGSTPRNWTDHGRRVEEADWIWAAAIGPQIPATGSRADVTGATQSQVAATIAALLGLDYVEADQRVAPPLPILRPRRD